jgi:ATP-dependent DNA ligase
MHLESHPPLPAMEAKAVDSVPVGDEWQYEPKWDGFCCVAFREDSKIELQSKSAQPLFRYFPIVGAPPTTHANPFVEEGNMTGTLEFSNRDELLARSTMRTGTSRKSW